MIVETTYNIGDSVWYMESNTTKQGIIHSIKISVGQLYTDTHYAVRPEVSAMPIIDIHSKKLFSTKQKLLATL